VPAVQQNAQFLENNRGLYLEKINSGKSKTSSIDPLSAKEKD
jgi:hypothetical protein